MDSMLNGIQRRSGESQQSHSNISATILQALNVAGLSPHVSAVAASSTMGINDRAGTSGNAAHENDRSERFTTHSFSNSAGSRSYKLYVPHSYDATAKRTFALIVMLHGCTQSPDDFAAGTQMNNLAEKHGFLVLYPAQSANGNGSKCWNWFRTEDQLRDCGEPSLIAGMTQEVARNFRIDDRRIFAAGLSAGAAMAVILGETYPDIYAGIGIHSGLAYAAAHDAPSAFRAMQGLHDATVESSRNHRHTTLMPTIIFHGNRDTTVAEKNAGIIVQHVLATDGSATSLSKVQSRGEAGGRGFDRTVYRDQAGHTMIECWSIDGAGHAWSGGDRSGSYTDSTGPNASAEMLRFFFALPQSQAPVR
ncbi:extracellular catalytic domain type 1 short-chain-length polyhydroxyalkanoate depolymerase [Pseudolysobacter antarcticus]